MSLVEPANSDEEASPPIAGASLRRNFSWALAGNLIYAACQWLVIVVIAKLGSAAMVGQFTLGVAVCAPVMLFCGMALRVVQANDVGRSRPFGVYLGLRLLSTVTALLVIGGIVVLNGYSQATAATVLLIGMAKAAEAVSEIFWGQLQQRERMSTIATSMVIKGVLSVLAVAVLLEISNSLPMATLGFAVAWMLTLLVCDVPAGRSFEESLAPIFTKGPLLRLARTAIPLGVVVMLASFSINVPRYFLVHHRSETELGIFSAIANLMVAGSAIITALGQAVAPRLARRYLNGEREQYVRLLGLLCGCAVALGSLGIAVACIGGGPLLTLLYTREYAASTDVLVLSMVAALMTYVVSALGVAVIAAGEFRAPVPLQAINLLIVVAGSRLVIPRMGATGAAWVLVISNLVTAAMFALLVRRCVRAIPTRDF